MTAIGDSRPYGIIYCITNKANGKCYIGQTTRTLAQRWAGHLNSSGKNGCRILGAAIVKYGRDAFETSVVATAETQEALDALEIALIEQFGVTDRAIGYNIALGGSGGKQSAETIALRVSKNKGKKRSEEFRQQVSRTRKGARHSEETRARLSALAAKRPPPSDETRKKLVGAAKRGVWTPGRRANAAAKAKGKTHTDETKRKLAEIFTGHKQSAETIAKRVAANTGRVRSEETRRRISEVRKAYWAAKRGAPTE